MQKPDVHTIQQATQRAKQRLSIDTLRNIPKYKNITQQEYDNLFKYAETFSLMALDAFMSNE